MKRSVFKLPYYGKRLFKNLSEKSIFKLSGYRSSNIPFHLVNKKVSMYNGAWLLTRKLEETMVGLKIGEILLLNVLIANLKRKDVITQGKKIIWVINKCK